MLNNYTKPQLIATGALHEIPADLKKILLSDTKILEKWNNLTPIMRNEWICWVTHVKKQETRNNHLKRFSEEILQGKRRPCCWPGCPHRNPNSKKWFKN